MKSPLNPAVRADMQASIAKSKALINTLQNAPSGTTGVSGGEVTVTPGVQAGPGYFTHNPGMPVAPAAPNLGGDQGTTGSQGTTGGSQGGQGGDQGVPFFLPSETRPPSESSLTLGSGKQAYAAPPSEQKFGLSPFANPRGTAEPESAPGETKTAETQPAAVQQPASYQPPTQTDEQKRALAQWQVDQAHPVADAPSALAWAKRHGTSYTDATYMGSGGPGGEPAYAFTDKRGGTSIVPLSQMVRNGFAPSVVQQNQSVALSATEAQKDQERAAMGQPPQGQLPQEELTRRIAAAANVASTGGPDISTLSASTQKGVPDNYTKSQQDDNADNPSNLPIVDGKKTHPGGGIDNNVNNAAAKARANNYADSQDTTTVNGNKLVFVDPNSHVRWYSDPRTSGVPFVLYGSTPWSEMRMPNDGKWQIQEVPLPDKMMVKSIYDKSGLDTSGWTQGQRVAWLMNSYNLGLTTAADEPTRMRVTTLQQQAVNAQHIQDAFKIMPPGKLLGFFSRAKQEFAKHLYDAYDMPFDQAWQKIVKNVAPNGVDANVQKALMAFGALKGAADSRYLTDNEKSELKALNLDASLPDLIDTLHHNRMGQFNDSVHQAAADKMRLDQNFIDDASSVSTNNRMLDDGKYYNPGQNGEKLEGRATPSPTPEQMIRRQPDNSREKPYVIQGVSQEAGNSIIKRLEKPVWVSDGHGNIKLIQ